MKILHPTRRGSSLYLFHLFLPLPSKLRLFINHIIVIIMVYLNPKRKIMEYKKVSDSQLSSDPNVYSKAGNAGNPSCGSTLLSAVVHCLGIAILCRLSEVLFKTWAGGPIAYTAILICLKYASKQEEPSSQQEEPITSYPQQTYLQPDLGAIQQANARLQTTIGSLEKQVREKETIIRQNQGVIGRVEALERQLQQEKATVATAQKEQDALRTQLQKAQEETRAQQSQGQRVHYLERQLEDMRQEVARAKRFQRMTPEQQAEVEEEEAREHAKSLAETYGDGDYY